MPSTYGSVVSSAPPPQLLIGGSKDQSSVPSKDSLTTTPARNVSLATSPKANTETSLTKPVLKPLSLPHTPQLHQVSFRDTPHVSFPVARPPSSSQQSSADSLPPSRAVLPLFLRNDLSSPGVSDVLTRDDFQFTNNGSSLLQLGGNQLSANLVDASYASSSLLRCKYDEQPFTLTEANTPHGFRSLMTAPLDFEE